MNYFKSKVRLYCLVLGKGMHSFPKETLTKIQLLKARHLQKLLSLHPGSNPCGLSIHLNGLPSHKYGFYSKMMKVGFFGYGF